MLIVSCSHGRHIGKKIGKKHADLIVDKFPDGELRVRISASVKGKKVFLVQSFYKDISDCIIEVILAAKTCKELGAKKVSLIAPYFPYMRQDKRFRTGEAISQRIIGQLTDEYFDAIYTIDPHLHRTHSLKQVFKIKSVELSATKSMAEYIQRKIKNPIIIGPDAESSQWAEEVAKLVGTASRVLAKRRYSSYHVEVKLNREIDLKNKSAVIIDDIVSTGHTILEAVKILEKFRPKKIYCICTHGIFVNDALEKLAKEGIKVISTNTIPSKVSKIDVSDAINEKLN